MVIKKELRDFYCRADQVHLVAIWKEGDSTTEHMMFLEPNLDFKLTDGNEVEITIDAQDVHNHLDDMEIVELDYSEENE